MPITWNTLATVLAGIAAFSGVMSVWFGMIPPKQIDARARRIEQTRRDLKKASLAQKQEHNQWRQKGMKAAQSFVQRFKLLGTEQAKKIREKLSVAGWRTRDAAVVFVAVKLIMPLLFALGSSALFYGLEILGSSPQAKLLGVIASAGLGFVAPGLYVKNKGQNRQKRIQKGLPDALDLMVICSEAGLSLDSSLKRVNKELGESWPDISEEFGITSAELSYLSDRRQALDNLADRTGVQGIRALVNTLMQAEKYGTPLSQALRVISAEQRTKRMMAAEEKAARLPAVMTVPMILFILPSLFVVLIGPGALRVIDGLSKL